MFIDIQGRCRMKAIVVTDEAAGTAGMTLVERPEPEPAINDVVVQVHASGFTSGELTWPSTWTDRLGRDRTPSIPGHWPCLRLLMPPGATGLLGREMRLSTSTAWLLMIEADLEEGGDEKSKPEHASAGSSAPVQPDHASSAPE